MARSLDRAAQNLTITYHRYLANESTQADLDAAGAAYLAALDSRYSGFWQRHSSGPFVVLSDRAVIGTGALNTNGPKDRTSRGREDNK